MIIIMYNFFCILLFFEPQARVWYNRLVTADYGLPDPDFVSFPPITECYTVPGAPPRNVTGKAISPTSILVTWEPPAAERSNGRIAYYRLQVVESGRSDSEARNIKLNDTSFVLDELKKWTEYRIWVLAGTRVGDGPPSYPILVRTHEDGMYHRH